MTALEHLERREPIPGLSDTEALFYADVLGAFHWSKQIPNGPFYQGRLLEVVKILHGEHVEECQAVEQEFPKSPLPQHHSGSPVYLQQFANGQGCVQRPSFVEGEKP